MRVQIGDIATVIFGFIAAILLMINEVGFSPVSTPRQFNDKDTINAVLDYTLRDSLLFAGQTTKDDLHPFENDFFSRVHLAGLFTTSAPCLLFSACPIRFYPIYEYPNNDLSR